MNISTIWIVMTVLVKLFLSIKEVSTIIYLLMKFKVGNTLGTNFWIHITVKVGLVPIFLFWIKALKRILFNFQMWNNTQVKSKMNYRIYNSLIIKISLSVLLRNSVLLLMTLDEIQSTLIILSLPLTILDPSSHYIWCWSCFQT